MLFSTLVSTMFSIVAALFLNLVLSAWGILLNNIQPPDYNALDTLNRTVMDLQKKVDSLQTRKL